jgi:hypothetical protein
MWTQQLSSLYTAFQKQLMDRTVQENPWWQFRSFHVGDVSSPGLLGSDAA